MHIPRHILLFDQLNYWINNVVEKHHSKVSVNKFLVKVLWTIALVAGAPVGMWTWGHVHTKFWQNLVKNQNYFFFQYLFSSKAIDWNLESFIKLILMKTFSNCTHFQPFLKLRKSLRGKLSIWRYCWLHRTLSYKSSMLQELRSLFWSFQLQKHVGWGPLTCKQGLTRVSLTGTFHEAFG